MKAIVLSTKGGVGKTTFAIQVLAPYLNQKFKQKVPFFIGDTVNEDARIFNSELFEISNSKFYLDKNNDNFIQELALQQSCIVDVGGNQSTELFIKEVEDKSFLIDDNFVFFIPTLSDTQSVTNAVKTYLNLQKISENFKTCFVLSQVKELKDVEVKIQFHRFFDYKIEFQKNFICVPESELFADSMDYKMTVFEIAKLAEKASENYKKLVKENKNLPREEFLEKTSSAYDNKIFSARCKVLVENELAKTFEQLDKELGGK